MTSPGPVERVPLKVVPLYVQQDEPQPETDEVIVEASDARRSRLLGIAAVALALIMAGLQLAGIVTATAGDFTAGTLLAFAAIGVAVLAFAAGIVAAITARGRWWGVAAALAALLANPLTLLTILRLLSGAQST